MSGLRLAAPAEAAAIKRSLAARSDIPTPAATPTGVHPGTERWPVKTGADDDVAQVGPAIVESTVREMGSFARPDELQPPTALHDAYNAKRVAPVETTVWRVSAQIIALRMESDGDYHLVLQDDSGATMVAEVPLPDPAFVAPTSPFFDDIAKARSAVNTKFGLQAATTEFARITKPNGTPVLVPRGSLLHSAVEIAAAGAVPATVNLASSTAAPQTAELFAMRISATPATVTGVGFFDRAHGASGAAPNVIEIHPVLDITFGV